MKIVTKFAVWGAIGFGVGGAIGGAVMLAFNAPAIGMSLFGAIGGAALGLALKHRKRAVFLALAGAIGLLCGQALAFGIGYYIVVERGLLSSVAPLISGTVMGAIVGALLALALKDWKGMGLLALAGAIGFSIAMLSHQGAWQETQLAIWGLIGGTFLGAASGYLEKRRAG